MIYAIDMGHTLTGLGTGASGIVKETDINRQVGKKLIEYLGQLGETVVNCTVDNSVRDLSERVALVNSSKADLFVSIHLNAGGGQGTETYIYNKAYEGKEENRVIAKRINDAVAKSCNFPNRGVKEENFHVLRETIMKAVLVELFFVDSVDDCNKYNVDNIAKALAESITNKKIVTISQSSLIPGNKIQIIGTKYANVDKLIPEWVKKNIYEIVKIDGDKALIKDINSWVLLKDLVTANNVATPTVTPQIATPKVNYLYLMPHMTKWNVYPTNVPPVRGNEYGTLAPSFYKGLEYQILANPQKDVYTIQTESFGKVNIYVPKDNDSKFYSK